MTDSILASVGTLTFIDKTTKELIGNARALTTENLDITSTLDLIRGGMLNGVQGTLVHDTQFGVTADSSTFNLNYMALNCGGQITANGNTFKTETVTTVEANKITVSNTPLALDGENGSTVYGWYKLQSSIEDSWNTITFDADTKTATVTGVPVGSVLCVKYIYSLASIKQFKVSSAFIPKVVHAILTIPEFAAGATSVDTNSSQIGQLVIDIPNYTFSGSQSYSLSAGGASTAPLGGTALITYGGGSCDDKGYYATINEEIFGQGDYVGVKELAVVGGNIELATTEKATIVVKAFYGDGTMPSTIDNSKLTFTATGSSATVDTSGVVTASSTTGVTTIEIVVTDKPELTTACVVTVE